MSAYIDADHSSALLDLIELRGELIRIEGEPVRAFVQREEESQEASEYGSDTREEEITATFKAKVKPQFSFSVTIQGRNYTITDIDPATGGIYTLTLEND